MRTRSPAPALTVSTATNGSPVIFPAVSVLRTINSFRPGTATYVQIEGMTHGFERAASQRASFEARGAAQEFHSHVFDEIANWLAKQGARPAK